MADRAQEAPTEGSQWYAWPPLVRQLVSQLVTGKAPDGKDAPVSVISARYDGAFMYRAGVDGTPDLPPLARVVAITAEATDGAPASVTIDGGDTISIRAGGAFRLVPEGKLIDPTITFTGTRQWFVQLVDMDDED